MRQILSAAPARLYFSTARTRSAASGTDPVRVVISSSLQQAESAEAPTISLAEISLWLAMRRAHTSPTGRFEFRQHARRRVEEQADDHRREIDSVRSRLHWLLPGTIVCISIPSRSRQGRCHQQ